MRNNTFPKGVIIFENLFNIDDQLRRENILSSPKNFKELQIAPNKVLKIDIKNTPKDILEIAKIMKAFAGIMVSSYDDLKVYNRSVI